MKRLECCLCNKRGGASDQFIKVVGNVLTGSRSGLIGNNIFSDLDHPKNPDGILVERAEFKKIMNDELATKSDDCSLRIYERTFCKKCFIKSTVGELEDGQN